MSLDKYNIPAHATEIADWVYEDHPDYPKLVDRLKTIMELYWYRGRDDAQQELFKRTTPGVAG
jgi:hypothetical protein